VEPHPKAVEKYKAHNGNPRDCLRDFSSSRKLGINEYSCDIATIDRLGQK